MSTKKPAAKPVATLADLTPDPQNARKHNPRNIGQVQNSLQKYGAARSIVIDENNQIIAGHGVVEAAGLAGIERVQVVEADGETIIAVRRSGLTKKQKIELGIADNRGAELAEWDTDVLKGWAGSDIDLEQFWNKAEWEQLVPPTAGNDAADPGAQVDKAAELQAKWGTALGQLWQIGRHRLLVGDCTVAENVAGLMGGEKAALVLTDPPFGNDLGYGRGLLGERYIEGDDDTVALVKLPEMANRDLQDATHCLVWVQWRTYSELEAAFIVQGFKLRTVVVWDKKQPGLSGGGFAEQHEWMCVFLKGEARQNEYSGNVWTVSRETGFGGRIDHPHMKPLELIEKAVSLCSKADDVVLDYFLGSGTTLVACEKLGRSGRGMELSPAYAAVTLERLSGLGLTPELLP